MAWGGAFDELPVQGGGLYAANGEVEIFCNRFVGNQAFCGAS